MLNPKRLWRALEEIPGQTAVRAEWRHWLSEDHAWVEKNLLRPTGEIAAAYPSDHGEPYQVIDHGGGRYRAVHPDGRAPLDLAKADVTILRLDVTKLAEHLCKAFGFVAEDLVQAQAVGGYRIGKWAVTDRTACSVWLCVQPDQSLLHDLLLRLATESTGPFVVFTPDIIDDAVLSRTLTAHSVCSVPLIEAVDSADSGSLVVTLAGASRLEVFQRSMRGIEAAVCADDQGQGLPSTRPAEDRYEWARQVDLVRATIQVLGDGMLNKGVLSHACADGHVETNGKTGRGARVRVRSFLTWVSRQNQIGADEANQIRNAVIGEISSRNS